MFTVQRSVGELAGHYEQVRQQTVSLCQPLHPEEYLVQPTPNTSPPKWHLGHTTWFFENFILAAYCPQYTLYAPDWNFYFNSYYESQGRMVPKENRGFIGRPATEEVLAYRKHVDEHLIHFLQGLPEEHADTVEQLVTLGIHHEQQHQELLVYDVKYAMGHNPYIPVYHKRELEARARANPMKYLEFPGGLYETGNDGHYGFCYDNETSRHQSYLYPFAIADRLLTNGEYLEFVEAGGYHDYQWWHSDGWDWVQENGIEAPLYWRKAAHGWHEYTLSGLKPLDLQAPVNHVSYYEAWACAQFFGKRLPSEAEWEVACVHSEPTIPEAANLLESNCLDTRPVKQKGETQFYGHTWEWTESAYLPYPYYRRPEGALAEYNGKFMVNQMVLRGGSAATPASHIRATYRNFFYAYDRWQYAGIRMAESR